MRFNKKRSFSFSVACPNEHDPRHVYNLVGMDDTVNYLKLSSSYSLSLSHQDFFTESQNQSRMDVLLPKLQEANHCLNDLISCSGMVNIDDSP